MKVCELACFEYFYKALFAGFYICIMYDLIRCILEKNKILRDTIFTIVSFLYFIYFLLFTINGHIRWYVVVTMVLGIILYFLVLSREVCKVLLFFTKKIKKFLHFIFKILLTVTGFFGKILSYIDKCKFLRFYRRGIINEKDKI